MPRILNVVADVDPLRPGEQACLIAPYLRDRWTVEFFCGSAQGRSAANGVTADRWHSYPIGKRNWLGAARSLWSLLQSTDYAIVHTWDRRSSQVFDWVRRFLHGRRGRFAWVRQANGDAPLGVDRECVSPIMNRRFVIGDPWLLASRPIDERSAAIPLAVLPAHSQSASLRTELGIPSSVRLLGTVCGLEARFGLKHLIWVLDQMKCVRDDLRLVVWGRGSFESQLRQYARLVGVADWVYWLSPHRRVREELAELDVYWQASRTEPTSAELVAALISGVPAFAPRTPSSQELAKTWSNQLHLVTWGARDEIARQTQQLLQRGSPADSHAQIEEWMRLHEPSVVAAEYDRAYQRVLSS